MPPHNDIPDWLVQTKFHPPLLRGDLIPRENLLVALREAVTSQPLTLLSAPAGYGKTTLLASLAQAFSELPLAWLTVDAEDNDPTRFLTAFIYAAQRLAPECILTAQSLLTSLENPGAEVGRVVSVLINDLMDCLPDPSILILDDLHQITEPANLFALDYLLDHLPSQLHLVVSTRHDPPLNLARLRAAGRLAELLLTDLQFTADETTAFLNVQSQLGLPSNQLAALQNRTEGWAAGLRLLASSLDRIPASADREAFIENVAQTDRHIFDFLAEEVLDRQEDEVQAFLLETSILSELTPAMCRVVTGKENAGRILEALYHKNLFLVAVSGGILPAINEPPFTDAESKVYRYHALFAEFLQRRLWEEMPEHATALHRRAAKAETDPVRAIDLYLAAGLWELVADAIERIGSEMLQRGVLDTLLRMILALPYHVREARPRLLHLQGACIFRKGKIEEAERLLQRALHDFEDTGDEEGIGLALSFLAGAAILQGDIERSGKLVERALAFPLPPRRLMQMHMARSIVGLFRGEWDQVLKDIDAALKATEMAKDPYATLMQAFYLNPLYAAFPGGLERIERFCQQAPDRRLDPRGPLHAGVQELMSFVHLWRGRLDDAIQAGELALEINERLGDYPFLGFWAAMSVATAYAARGNYTDAERYFEVMLHQGKQTAVGEATMASTLYLLGRASWSQGQMIKARQLHAEMITEEKAGRQRETLTPQLMLQGLLEIGSAPKRGVQRYKQAELTLLEAVSQEQATPTFAIYGSARLVLAHLYTLWGRSQDALTHLAPLLAECETQDTPGRIMIEGALVVAPLRLAVADGVHTTFATRILDAITSPNISGRVLVPGSAEHLTPRQMEVLHMIAAGASNREIAEQLVIGEETVKTHVAHILRKLDVTSRTQAAAIAHQLGILN